MVEKFTNKFTKGLFTGYWVSIVTQRRKSLYITTLRKRLFRARDEFLFVYNAKTLEGGKLVEKGIHEK